MKVLLIGGGGREHALATGLAADEKVTELHAAPGNPGIAQLAKLHSIAINDNQKLVALAKDLAVDLVVIGPEAPLVNGLADDLSAANIPVFGPSKAAAQLESSKDFAKSIMHKAAVPTANSLTCETTREIEEALDKFGAPYVVKDDGLAAGKGVVVTDDRNVALQHALSCKRVVIEEYLDGPEISLFGISDGNQILALQPAQDFKRAYDNDEGPNTGGMGAYSPLHWAPINIEEEVHQKVLAPMISIMKSQGTPFVGLLYAGLALTKEGIKVIEFNARFGDPETQVLIPRLKTPLGQLLYKAATGNLEDTKLEWRDESAVTVVLAANGYPNEVKTGDEISQIPNISDTLIFHAGTKMQGALISAGGRVLTVTGLGNDLTLAKDRAYQAISKIRLAGSFYRRDIALNASIDQKAELVQK